ncbi:MacS family sensor histidine kinase [Nocardioides sp. CPCC 205120]|uniref:MacS family sensor histidine kinase n=1 Tax=Nocardioides sp. CPCC 205120 TaxID=3406462 RepID=UPI003B5137D4
MAGRLRILPPGWRDAAAVAVEDRMFRALAVLRVVLLVNAVALNVVRRDNAQVAWALWASLLLMVGWTAVAVWGYAVPARRRAVLLVLDLTVTAALLLVSLPVKGEGLRATIPGFWIMGALLAWAVHWRWRGGLVAAVVLIAADVSVRQELSQTNYGHLFLIGIGAPLVGYLCESLQRMAAERDRAEREAAVASERARLARAVHDGVLQVLALTQRRGADLGPGGAELARLAGEQEAALRALIRQQDTLTTPGAGARDEVDLAGAVEELGHRDRPRVAVVTPGVPVRLPADVVAELVAAAGACLDNVAVHVGDDAPAWVLLEDLGDSVVLTVRDEGPGIPAGRLEEAEAAGRLGVSGSVRGRLADLGGTAELATGSFGTEWELTVPRAGVAAS